MNQFGDKTHLRGVWMKRGILFYDAEFPYVGERPSEQVIKALQEVFEVVNVTSLQAKLRESSTTCLVLLHGSYFPKEAWTEIFQHVKRGGGLVCVGGPPFQFPVRPADAQWITESMQYAYHRQLHIEAALPVAIGSICSLRHNEDIPLLQAREHVFSIQPTYGLVIRGTHANDLPTEHGTSGPMEAHIYPLLKGIGADSREMSAPVVMIEHTKADFSAGRWILMNQIVDDVFWSQGGVEVLREWSEYCALGVTEVWLQPNYACYRPGEMPILNLRTQKVSSTISDASQGRHGKDIEWCFTLHVYALLADGTQEKVWSKTERFCPTSHWEEHSIPVPIRVHPGMYRVECHGESQAGERRVWRQGFWGMDEQLLAVGTRMTCERDYFEKDGRPFPIVGMTYMASDVARKYLFIPNPAVWDRDMREMKRAGINLIRTGLWTGWRTVMFVDGHPSEPIMRAIDAFLLTAKRHDLEVTFNFFAFTPEAWDGSNPYLDPHSVASQKRFVGAVVSRHRNTTNVQWDLINEPSVFDPRRVFRGPQSMHDVYETEAWILWLAERHADIAVLQERWDMTPDELPSFASAKLPEQSEINFGITDMSEGKRGQRWLDYCLFTMDMFNRWVREISDAIRYYVPDTLITVGQDEAMVSQRPSPFFYAETVDYTTVHSWWQMDDLVWDGIFTKTFDKPNLVQETGIMYAENTDGAPKRAELELRNILERKYAIAFATGSAGAVHWLWNTNLYMNDVNEVNIGALRADGTQKPEADVSYDFGQFMANSRDIFVHRQLEDTVVVYPYANDFSNRSMAFQATTQLTRILLHHMKIPFRALGEFHLGPLKTLPPKLIIVPSAHHFSRDAREMLLNHVSQHGGVLLWTGPLHRDEYWDPIPPIHPSILSVSLGNVLREESLTINGRKLRVPFPNSRIAQVNKEMICCSDAGLAGSEGEQSVYEIPVGRGLLLWCPLPVELGSGEDALIELYSTAAQRAGVGPELVWESGPHPGVFGRKVTFRDAALFIFISESGDDQQVKVTDPITGLTYAFWLQRDRSVLFTTDSQGSVQQVYRSGDIHVEVTKRGNV